MDTPTPSDPKRSGQGWLPRLIPGAALALLIILLTQGSLLEITPLTRLELSTIDYRFRMRGNLPVPQESLKVVIVEINRESFRSLPEHFPWPRAYYARLVRNLKRAGAAAVGFDIVFDQPDKAHPGSDEDLRNAMKETGIVVVGGKTDISSGTYTEKRADENYNSVFFGVDSSIGIVYLRNDDDGIYRRYRPFTVDPARGLRIPTLSFAVLNKYDGKGPFYVAENRASEFVYDGRPLPKFDPTSVLINYYGPDRTFVRLKFVDLIDDKDFKTVDEISTGADINTFDDPDIGYLSSGILKGKIVLVGSTEPEEHDILPVPLPSGQQAGDNMMCGVEIHANVIQNTLDGTFLRKEPWWIDVSAILVFCLTTFLAMSKFKEIKFKRQIMGDILGIILMVAELALIGAVSLRLFSRSGYVTVMTSPVLAVLLGYVGALVYNYVAERKQKMLIKGMFSQYVNPTVVEELVANPEKLRLGGERDELTVMFSDIEGFTGISESLEPERLVAILNEYLSLMTHIIFSNQGTLDKFEGDAIMAFWGAPIPQADHAMRACRTSIEMFDTLDIMRKEWKKDGRPDINIRIGLNTGDMIVGNMGGLGRFDYTVIGDSVNLAARLESANKQYHTRLMIGDRTYRMVSDRIVARELDKLVVMGKTEPVTVYELIQLASRPVTPEQLQFLELYQQALTLYRSRQWSAAITGFEKALKVNRGDHTCQIYIERSRLYESMPPPDDWNGVFVLRTK
jgi:adenylate cyclase